MRDSIGMIRNMVLVSILGLMEEDMKDIGLRGNNMVLVLIWFLKIIRLNMEFGKMERESNGSMKEKSQL